MRLGDGTAAVLSRAVAQGDGSRESPRRSSWRRVRDLAVPQTPEGHRPRECLTPGQLD